MPLASATAASGQAIASIVSTGHERWDSATCRGCDTQGMAVGARLTRAPLTIAERWHM